MQACYSRRQPAGLASFEICSSFELPAPWQKDAGEGRTPARGNACTDSFQPAVTLWAVPDPHSSHGSGCLDHGAGAAPRQSRETTAILSQSKVLRAWGRCEPLGGAWLRQRRRLAANARERRRMLVLNVAFDRLRSVVPALRGERKLSKADTLQMAKIYISMLSDLLKGVEQVAPGREVRSLPASSSDQSTSLA
ncbi:hypothetical protein lerEdw1_013858 [Lerista edwardsae]|nr:hypothetical protein lerEdw1_013858 [Lerista edwardsae]